MRSVNDILFVGPLPPPFGGVAVTNLNWQKTGKIGQYKIIAFDTSKKNISEDLYRKKTIFDLINGINTCLKYVRFLKRTHCKIVNVFCTSNSALLRDFLVILISKLFKKKIIVHFHSKTKGELFLGHHSAKLLRVFFFPCDYIVVLSAYHLDHFKKYLSIKKLKVIENFVHYSEYQYNLTSKLKNNFLYIGRISEKKGFYDLLRAVKRLVNDGLSDFVIHVLGTYDNDKTKDSITEYINKENLSSYFNFHGVLHGKEKVSYFQLSSAMIFPTHFENSPIVLKEAIASKLPVICSSILENKNIMRDNAIYFDVKNPESLYRAIKEVIIDPNLLEKLQSTYIEFNDYDFSTAEDKLISLINQLIPLT